MKKLILTFLGFFLVILLNAQSAKFQWAKGFGSIGEERNYDIALDTSGNSYSIGRYWLTVDFDPGPGISNLTSNGYLDIAILKLDSSGNFLWAKSFGGTKGDVGNSIALDPWGNIYVGGLFSNVVNFGTFTLTDAQGASDMFIMKLDAAGNVKWVKQFVGNDAAEISHIGVDSTGSVYATGLFRGNVDFNPGAPVFNITGSNNHDIFITKLDSSGNFAWAKSFKGGNYYNSVTDMDVDKSGNVYTTGYFYGTADFDPGTATFNMTASGNADIYISKLNSSGNFVWAKRVGGIDAEEANSISLDGKGNIILTGNFWGMADFDPGTGVYNMTKTSPLLLTQDLYILKLDTSGNFVWAKQIGNESGGSRPSSLTTDLTGNIYASGAFGLTLDFDPGINTFYLTAPAPRQDIYIIKLDPLGNFIWGKSIGGDSATNASVEIKVSSSGSLYVAGTYERNPYFNSGSAAFTLSSFGQKDLFTAKMVSCQPSSSTFPITACRNYIFNNTNYTKSGVYSKFLSNSTGCDSIITLNLTINTVNDSITKLGKVLTAVASGATYQWVNCTDYSFISGATSKSYTATVNGNYAVIVSQSGCKDTSNCMTVSGVGIDDLFNKAGLRIYPNPNQGIFNIVFDIPIVSTSIEIYNSIGALVFSRTNLEKQNEFDLAGFAEGLYFIKLVKEDRIIRTDRIIIVK